MKISTVRTSLLCISLGLSLILSGCTDSGNKGAEKKEEKVRPVKGSMVPDATFYDTDGKRFDLAFFKGRPLIVNIWATWCPPCRDEMPSMEAFYHKFKETDLVFLPISIDERMSTIKEFMQMNRYAMPVYHDPDKSAGSAFGITGVPETFFIDREGKIVEKIIGPLDWMSKDVVAFVEEKLTPEKGKKEGTVVMEKKTDDPVSKEKPSAPQGKKGAK